MKAASGYILSLCCAALCCAVVLRLSGTDGPGGSIRRMICGIFLAIAVISPLKQVDLGVLDRELDAFSKEAERTAAEGSRDAGKTLDEDISRRCRAYILDQAGETDLDVTVEVDPRTHLPVAAVLTGEISTQEKQKLEEWISRELGMERSRLRWMHPS